MIKVGDEVLGGRVTKITALSEGLEVQVLVPHEPVEVAVAPVAKPVVEDKPAEEKATAKAAATKAVRK